jgi:hypothetical protein
MAFTIRIRGAAGEGTVRHDFLCEACGRFEIDVPRAETPDVVPCPACGAPSPWSPSSAPAVHTQFVVSTSRGKNDPKPHPLSMDLRNLGEGQKYREWKRERSKLWQGERHKRRKEYLAS